MTVKVDEDATVSQANFKKLNMKQINEYSLVTCILLHIACHQHASVVLATIIRVSQRILTK